MRFLRWLRPPAYRPYLRPALDEATDRLIADLRPLIDAGLLTDSTTTAAADDTAAAGTTHSPREDNES